jgi:hypothetical protein
MPAALQAAARPAARRSGGIAATPPTTQADAGARPAGGARRCSTSGERTHGGCVHCRMAPLGRLRWPGGSGRWGEGGGAGRGCAGQSRWRRKPAAEAAAAAARSPRWMRCAPAWGVGGRSPWRARWGREPRRARVARAAAAPRPHRRAQMARGRWRPEAGACRLPRPLRIQEAFRAALTGDTPAYRRAKRSPTPRGLATRPRPPCSPPASRGAARDTRRG